MTPLRRHTLVWLSQPPQPEFPDDAAAAEAWHAAGHPFVVCRQRCGPLALGFCLPAPGRRPRRIACHSETASIVRDSRPPRLAEISAANGARFAELSAAACDTGVDLRVFGSWMWQTLTGEAHVGPASDLDVLVDVSGRAAADRAAEFLRSGSGRSPCRIDGELAFPAGDVAWREYAGTAPEVLLKSIDAIRLVPREEL